jgi:endonuclease-3
MQRGVGPRQPTKSGRHEKALVARAPSPAKAGATIIRGRPKTSGPKSTKPAPGKKPQPVLKSYNPLAPERITEILARLDELYPDATCALTHHSPWELLVATILSAQSTDATVNRVTPELFRKYPTVKDFAALTPEQLEPDIYSTGFFRNKAKSVVGAAKKIVTEFRGEIPDEMDKLLTLPGVARKTANVLLGTWFGQGIGIVVDTHVTRISRRLELTKNTDPSKIEQDLMKVIPPQKWILFAHQIIWHGRRLCIARKPNCVECPLENLCHAGDKTWSTVEIHKRAK